MAGRQRPIGQGSSRAGGGAGRREPLLRRLRSGAGRGPVRAGRRHAHQGHARHFRHRVREDRPDGGDGLLETLRRWRRDPRCLAARAGDVAGNRCSYSPRRVRALHREARLRDGRTDRLGCGDAGGFPDHHAPANSNRPAVAAGCSGPRRHGLRRRWGLPFDLLVTADRPARAAGRLLHRQVRGEQPEYKEFVSAGGYVRREFWKHPFVKDGRPVGWDAAMQMLVDRTGLPGPRSWSNQSFAEGRGAYPVVDITWYESCRVRRLSRQTAADDFPVGKGGP